MCTKILMESIVVTTHSVVNMGHYIVAANDSVVNMAHYIIAANDSVVNMAITSLQQLIRGSIWPLHRCSN